MGKINELFLPLFSIFVAGFVSLALGGVILKGLLYVESPNYAVSGLYVTVSLIIISNGPSYLAKGIYSIKVGKIWWIKLIKNLSATVPTLLLLIKLGEILIKYEFKDIFISLLKSIKNW